MGIAASGADGSTIGSLCVIHLQFRADTATINFGY